MALAVVNIVHPTYTSHGLGCRIISSLRCSRMELPKTVGALTLFFVHLKGHHRSQTILVWQSRTFVLSVSRSHCTTPHDCAPFP